MTFQFASMTYSWVAATSRFSGAYGAMIGSSAPMCSAKSGAAPDVATNTQPCHSVTGRVCSP